MSPVARNFLLACLTSRFSTLFSITITLVKLLEIGTHKDPRNGFVGYVTRFRIDALFASRYPVHTVGAKHHRELWVPAEELAKFNDHIDGYIEVIAEFRLERNLSC